MDGNKGEYTVPSNWIYANKNYYPSDPKQFIKVKPTAKKFNLNLGKTVDGNADVDDLDLERGSSSASEDDNEFKNEFTVWQDELRETVVTVTGADTVL